MGSFIDILNKKAKEWDAPKMLSGGDIGPKIPFSSPELNYITYGGIPRGKISMFYGPPGGGKSSTSIDICHTAMVMFQQEYDEEILALKDRVAKGDKAAHVELDELEERGPKKVAYFDIENTFDWKWAKKMHINKGDIILIQVPNVPGEDVLQTLLDCISAGDVGLAVVDSVPSLVTRAQLGKKLGEKTVASLAGLLTEFCPKVIPLLNRYDTTLLLINQLRVNMDNQYVDQIPGGEAIKFYSSLIVRFKVGCPVDFLGSDLPMSAENPKGFKISAKLTKQKTAPWDRRNGSYYLMVDSGIRVDMDYAQLAVNKYGVIRKSGAWFTICDPETGEILVDSTDKPVKVNGMAKVYDYLQTNPEYFEKLKTFIVNDIENNGLDEDESDTELGDYIE